MGTRLFHFFIPTWNSLELECAHMDVAGCKMMEITRHPAQLSDIYLQNAAAYQLGDGVQSFEEIHYL